MHNRNKLQSKADVLDKWVIGNEMKFNTDNKSHGIAINGTETPRGIPNWKTSPEVL